MKTNGTLIVGLSLWMYFGGPLVWGAWITWRLGIYTPLDFLVRLWPTGLVILCLFFAAHCLNLRRPRGGQAVFATHYALMAAFGLAGTAVFLLAPTALGIDGAGALDRQALERALWGSLAGASLVGLFYPFFSTRLLASLTGFAGARSWMRHFNLVMFLGGFGAYVVTALWSGNLDHPTIPGFAGLLFPVVMATLLSWKNYQSLRIPRGMTHERP